MVIIPDDSKVTLKGKYQLGLDSSISSLEDNSIKGRENLFAIAAEGTSNYLMLAASSFEEKSLWISNISAYIEGVRSAVFWTGGFCR